MRRPDPGWLIAPAGKRMTEAVNDGAARVKRPGRYKLVIEGDVSKTLKLKVKKRRRR